MWKRITFVIGLALVSLAGLAAYLSDKTYLRSGHVAVAPAGFERRYKPQDLRADFVFLTATIERVHPSFSAIVDRQSYDKRRAEVLARLNQPMTRQEFYRAASLIDGEFHDGHTTLLRPQEEWNAYKASAAAVVPLLLEFDEQGAVVEKSLGIMIFSGARLVSVNGLAGGDLRERLEAATSGETTTVRRAYASEHFAAMAWETGLRSPYQIEWINADGKRERNLSNGVPYKTWEEARGTVGSRLLELKIDNGVAHLVISSLDEPMGRFRAFLKAAFTEIRDQRVQAVVIDLRQNGGGDSRQGDLLQSYLSDQVLPALEEVTVRTTPEVKARYRTLLPEGFRWIPINSIIPMLRGIQNGPDNGFFVFHPDGAAPKRRTFTNSLAFQGDVYVLISPLTYSSAVIFAAPLKYWRRATLVGEPAGEPLTFFGDNYEFDLPNTKLVASVSHKTFRLLSSRGPHSFLEPDLAVAPGQDAYQAALQDIARRRAVRRRS